MKIVTTRKEHDCFTCGLPIKKGEKAKIWLSKYLHHDSLTETYFESHYFHMNCKIMTPEEWSPPKIPNVPKKRRHHIKKATPIKIEDCKHEDTVIVYRKRGAIDVSGKVAEEDGCMKYCSKCGSAFKVDK